MIDLIQSEIKMSCAMIEDGNKLLDAWLVKMFVSLFIEGQEKVRVDVSKNQNLIQNWRN